MKVLIAPQTLVNLDRPFLHLLREAGFEIGFPPRPVQMNEEELLREVPGLTASLAGSEPYTRKVFEAAPDLRVIARAGVGYDAVDVTAATEHGVVVTIAPGTNHEAVAEHTFALILALAKDLVVKNRAIKTGDWPREPTLPLRGRTLGIVGLGRIGKAVAFRGACFGMKMLVYEPLPDQAFVDHHGLTLVPLNQLLAAADFVTLHIPLVAETRQLINRQTLALMKPPAFLINTARGGLVNETDLLEALQSRQLAGAGLDVFEQEPPGAHPLFELDNVLVTPHNAGVDFQSRDDMALSAAQAIVALSRGEWPAAQVVNPEVKPKFRWEN